MKNSSLIKKISSLFFILILTSFASCTSRLPKTSKSEKIITKYFNHYVKDYPTSLFGKDAVEKVDILEQTEIQKNVVNTTARITFKDSTSHTIHMTLLYKLPLGWRAQGWETLSLTENRAITPK